MLTAQAHTLDALFTALVQRAALNSGEYIGAADTYNRLALKAQSQCRATLETLGQGINDQRRDEAPQSVDEGPMQHP